MLVPVSEFISAKTWSYPTAKLAQFSEKKFIGNYTTRHLLASNTTLNWESQANLVYFCVFDAVPADKYHVRLPDCPGQRVCGSKTCCGMIDQYMTEYEYQQLSKPFCVRGKEFISEGFFAIAQHNASCLFFDTGNCNIHHQKPLWCKLYVCNLMWQLARKERGMSEVSCCDTGPRMD